MPTTPFPHRKLEAVQELAARLVESRDIGRDRDHLVRDLLIGFHDVCTRSGLDRVLVELAAAYPPFDAADRAGLADHPKLHAALLSKLDEKAAFDAGGPRNARPRMLAECILAVLAIELVEEPDRTIGASDAAREELIAALTGVIDADFTAASLRAAVVREARLRCPAEHHDAFDKISAQLDESGMRMVRQPKVRLDAVQAAQQALAEARNLVVSRSAGAAIDRVRPVLAKISAELAARLDAPISHRLTPRQVAIARACDARVPKVASGVVHALVEGLTELLHIRWEAAEQLARPYSPRATYVVGELVDHPKFGRGSVTSCATQRMEVQFADGTVITLVHVGPTK